MSKRYTVPALLTALLLFFGADRAIAQKLPAKGYECITEASARSIVEFLSSDVAEGRESGSRGGAVAAEYIVSQFKEWGVQPFHEEGYFQRFVAVKRQSNWVTEADMDISALVESGSPKRSLRNILAVIPGKEAGVVVVGAHYDHLGVDPWLKGDSCYNGADDNASGVSAVLQIAKAIKAGGKQPRRTIIFALWDGEEQGLLGSRFFVRKCSFLSDISAYMNFDMIGRGPAENPMHLSYMYTAANPLFGKWLRADVKKHKYSFVPFYNAAESLIGGSDNTPFARKGIPIVWYHTEGHPDYHRPSDSSEKIIYPKLTDITRAAALCVWRLANVRNY